MDYTGFAPAQPRSTSTRLHELYRSLRVFFQFLRFPLAEAGYHKIFFLAFLTTIRMRICAHPLLAAAVGTFDVSVCPVVHLYPVRAITATMAMTANTPTPFILALLLPLDLPPACSITNPWYCPTREGVNYLFLKKPCPSPEATNNLMGAGVVPVPYPAGQVVGDTGAVVRAVIGK